MTRWIAFDDVTADAVMSRFRRGAAEIRQGDALGAALDLGQPSLLILPSDIPGRVLLARCTPKNAAANRPEKQPLNSSQAVPKLPAQPQTTPRKWWQRLSA